MFGPGPTEEINVEAKQARMEQPADPHDSQAQYETKLDRERAAAELYRLATIDALTGLFNRRMFHNLAEREIAVIARACRHLGELAGDELRVGGKLRHRGGCAVGLHGSRNARDGRSGRRN